MGSGFFANPPLWAATMGMEHLPIDNPHVAGLFGFVLFFATIIAGLALIVQLCATVAKRRGVRVSTHFGGSHRSYTRR